MHAERTARQVSVLNNRASGAMYQGSRDTALLYIDRAVSTDPSNPVLWANQALYLLAGDPAFADPGTFTEGPAAGRRGSYPAKEALELFRKASALSPRDPVFIHNMAWLYLAGGDTDSARCSLRRVLELAPYDPAFLVSAGMFEEQADNRSAAVEYYSKALSAAPGLADSPFFRDLSQRSPRTAAAVVSRAVRSLEKELVQGGDYEAKSRMARLFLYLGDSTAAFELLTDVTQNHPGLNRAWLMLGSMAEGGNDSLALVCYRKARALDMSDPLPLFRLARIYGIMGDHRSASDFRQLAISRQEHSSSGYALRSYKVYQAQVWYNELYPCGLRSWISPDMSDGRDTMRRGNAAGVFSPE